VCTHLNLPPPVLPSPFGPAVIVKASSGPRYVVGCRTKVDKTKLTTNTRVTLDMTTLTIMRALPREVGAGCNGVVGTAGGGRAAPQQKMAVIWSWSPATRSGLCGDGMRLT
jgi:hypothetical protein